LSVFAANSWWSSAAMTGRRQVHAAKINAWPMRLIIGFIIASQPVLS
jgi:hypothetical protein